MAMKILKYGDPVLETPCDPVADSEFETAHLDELIDRMFETMYDAKGVGLAAPQVGVSKRLTVIDCSSGENEDEKLVLINPEITATEGVQTGEEGCLSIPGFRESVSRPRSVKARARNRRGEWFEIEAEDLTARAICHENDHLDGVLFLSRLSRLKRELIKRKIRGLRKKGEWD